MGQATFSNNTTIKVSSNSFPTNLISSSGGGTSTYTVPANSYLIITALYIPTPTSGTQSIFWNNYVLFSTTTGGQKEYAGGIYVPPGAVITFRNNDVSVWTAQIYGCLFTNTP